MGTGTPGRRWRAVSGGMKRILTLIFALLFCSGAARAEEEFITSYWDGPPAQFTTLERYQEIKDANFNLIFPPGGEMTVAQNRALLDIAQKLNLKAVIDDGRMHKALTGTREAQATL